MTEHMSPGVPIHAECVPEHGGSRSCTDTLALRHQNMASISRETAKISRFYLSKPEVLILIPPLP